MNLHWGYYLTNEGGQPVHVIFSKKDILDWKFHTDLLVNVLRPSLNFMACQLVDKSSMELHSRKYFLKKSCGHIYELLYRPNIRSYPQCKFPTDNMSKDRQMACTDE